MTRTVKSSILLLLLLGFFSMVAPPPIRAPRPILTLRLARASQQIPAPPRSTTPPVATSPAAVSDTPTTTGASANTSVKADNDLKDDHGNAWHAGIQECRPGGASDNFRSKQDPWEPVNRKIFGFNETVDDYLFRPVAKGYRWVMPDPLEIAVGNVFSNLSDIPITLNNLLQLKFDNALTSSMRVVVNTTAGLGGIFDVATALAWRSMMKTLAKPSGITEWRAGLIWCFLFLVPARCGMRQRA